MTEEGRQKISVEAANVHIEPKIKTEQDCWPDIHGFRHSKCVCQTFVRWLYLVQTFYVGKCAWRPWARIWVVAWFLSWFWFMAQIERQLLVELTLSPYICAYICVCVLIFIYIYIYIYIYIWKTLSMFIWWYWRECGLARSSLYSLLPYAAGAIASSVAGYAADKMLSNGMDSTKVRKIMQVRTIFFPPSRIYATCVCTQMYVCMCECVCVVCMLTNYMDNSRLKKIMQMRITTFLPLSRIHASMYTCVLANCMNNSSVTEIM